MLELGLLQLTPSTDGPDGKFSASQCAGSALPAQSFSTRANRQVDFWRPAPGRNFACQGREDGVWQER